MALPDNITDEALLELLRNGEEAGLDGLFRRHYETLCLLSIRIVKDPIDAEDVVQEFFLSFWKKRHVLPEIERVGPYLRRSIRNRSLNFLRDQKRIPTGNEEPLSFMSSNLGSANQQLETEELRERIDQAIDSLPERCRLVFVMSKLEDMKQKEIAEALNISIKTVENQMGRAYQYLRRILSACLLFGSLKASSTTLRQAADHFFDILAL